MSIHTRVLLAVAATLVVVLGGGASASTDYRTYVVRPPINNDPILADEALPVQCRDETVMKVTYARGEYEPASFLVQTEKPLKQVMVKVGALKGAAGTLSANAVDVRIAQKLSLSITLDT